MWERAHQPSQLAEVVHLNSGYTTTSKKNNTLQQTTQLLAFILRKEDIDPGTRLSSFFEHWPRQKTKVFNCRSGTFV
jgi:hypothetical protein